MNYGEIVEIIPPKIHNPPNWAGQPGGVLITHGIRDTRTGEVWEGFTNRFAAQCHLNLYEEYHVKKEENTEVEKPGRTESSRQ